MREEVVNLLKMLISRDVETATLALGILDAEETVTHNEVMWIENEFMSRFPSGMIQAGAFMILPRKEDKPIMDVRKKIGDVFKRIVWGIHP
jgi:hypothetical protein